MNSKKTEYVGVLEARRIIGDGCSTNRVYRYAVAGKVAVRLIPGEKPQYSRRDLERLAALGRTVQGAKIDEWTNIVDITT